MVSFGRQRLTFTPMGMLDEIRVFGPGGGVIVGNIILKTQRTLNLVHVYSELVVLSSILFPTFTPVSVGLYDFI